MKSFAGQCSSVALMELLITLTLTLRLRFSLHHSLPSWVASAVKILGYVDSALTCMLLRKLTTNERLSILLFYVLLYWHNWGQNSDYLAQVQQRRELGWKTFRGEWNNIFRSSPALAVEWNRLFSSFVEKIYLRQSNLNKPSLIFSQSISSTGVWLSPYHPEKYHCLYCTSIPLLWQ